MTNGLDFGVLGPLQVTVDGRPLPLGTPKQRAVLALLVMSRNRPVSGDALVTAAWEQFPPPEPKASLHSYISNLRKLISGTGADGRAVLASAAPGYRLAVDDANCDIGRFIAAKGAGVQAAAAGQFEQASNHLSTALAQWRGPVLDDLRDFEFVDPFATALVEDKVVAHTAHAEAEIACNRAFTIIGGLESLVVEYPYREPLWAQLITAYYLSDRQSDALDAYQRLKTTLADDLGIDPSPTVRSLHERILRQEPLNVRQAARTTAVHKINNLDLRTAVGVQTVAAQIRSLSGRVHPLVAAATRIGRLPDNDIVLDQPNVSRHHAVIIDTGTSFVITDLRSANGVEVGGQRIRGTATLDDGDRFRICEHEFVFEIVRPG
ncbi:DNA-binding transcriptional activator [Mycolicibacterium canariasense]|uniref:DNA-binding transcriptional activator n=1 Tax=Mycolicibacterium canariasense TaxID=228230 RepID=A0A117IB64_MYCCR|nr:BTAD domain-containing putative transcriptional regulator [Mycolicibacterium canariasense]MCV7210911.1 FHA domain-containing protein [Mycolicibacterium canariasense]ORV01535.1 regulator [Mycolicibacterium canariasense]GAS97429.1 DNA-binding transcriptional activator [Mycolicibacterium canariasense]